MVQGIKISTILLFPIIFIDLLFINMILLSLINDLEIGETKKFWRFQLKINWFYTNEYYK